MRYIDEEKRPEVFSTANCVKAVAVHVALFAALWYLGSLDISAKETAIPIDLLVVVNENLDGNPDEPPPEKPPEPAPPEPEPPKPEPPKPEPPKPKPPAPDVPAVVQEPVKTNVVKAVERPKPEAPKVDPKKAREERLKRMVASAKRAPDAPPPRDPPRNNGVTEMRPKDWEKLLMAGYQPSSRNAGLDADETQRCISYIQRAFYEKWDRPAWTDRLGEMCLSVEFGPGGKVLSYRLSRSSGDAAADRSVLRAASLVNAVRGLSPAFLEKNRTVTVRFTVKPEM